MPDYENLLRRAYTAFNARDIDAALSTMDPQVSWPNAADGTHLKGHEAVRDYWSNQWKQVDPKVEPRTFMKDDAGRTVVEVQLSVRSKDGREISSEVVRHVYTILGGAIIRMDIEKKK